MIVYHGTYMEIQSPDISYGRFNLDFGQGFYVTTLRQQAEKWAKRRAREATTDPIVNVYNFNLAGLNILQFSGYTEEWLDFISLNRGRKKPLDFNEYDVIYGNVADDAVARMVNYYVDLLSKNRLRQADKEFFIHQLQYSEPNNQYCVATQKAIERLIFKKSYRLGGDYA